MESPLGSKRGGLNIAPREQSDFSEGQPHYTATRSSALLTIFLSTHLKLG